MKIKDTLASLTDRQQKLLIELIRTHDIKAACKNAGVGRTSAYRWLSQPDFSGALKQLRDTAMNEALDSIKALTARAAEVLAALLDSENESIRRMVCRDILRQAVKVRELEDIEQRIDQLEQKIDHPEWRKK
ncbi:hypothetical protein P4B35_16815 [Pontiellaceae bacterium B12227]|nr:hypothetical protein [Pontiellaceae bacterium B12227]